MGAFRESYIIEKYNIIYQEIAQIDLFVIVTYIKYKLCNPTAASRFMSEIRKSILILQEFPYIGAKYKKDSNRIKIYRNFLIFYEIQEKEKRIIIKRIIHKNVNM